MRILVTGGAGFVGSHLVDELVKKHEVTIYDNLEPQVHKDIPAYLNKNAEFLREDVRDKTKLDPDYSYPPCGINNLST